MSDEINYTRDEIVKIVTRRATFDDKNGYDNQYSVRFMDETFWSHCTHDLVEQCVSHKLKVQPVKAEEPEVLELCEDELQDLLDGARDDVTFNARHGVIKVKLYQGGEDEDE